jgi:predicted transcriptional regulator
MTMAAKRRRLNVLVDDELFRAVEDAAKAQDVPAAHVVRTAIRKLVDERGTETVKVKKVGE